MSKPSHKIRLISKTRQLPKFAESRGKVLNNRSQPQVKQTTNTFSGSSFTDSFKKSPLRVRPQNTSLNRTLNYTPSSLHSIQKSTSKRQSKVKKEGVKDSLDSELSQQFVQIQRVEQRNLLCRKYKVAQEYFSKIIQKDPVFGSGLQQVKQTYQEYTSFLQNRSCKTGEIMSKIQKLENKEKQFVNLILALKEKGYPVQETYEKQVTKVPSLTVPPISSFHEQFMSHLPEFSESWRQLINQQHRLQ